MSALIASPDDEILLIRQPKWGEIWTLPGGHLEPGETLAAGAQREGEEETGLGLTLERMVNWGELIEREGRTRPVHFLFFDFAFRSHGKDLRLDASEISEARWVPFDEVLLHELPKDYRVSIERFLGEGT
ncbi:NUDIX domain-containing protein [Actinocorallia sp. B10E7]|uniref:NUDIX domain-containing protein n=1 Tax=Actinocorallia sp. B10E7 TaxID=3153558 RepID=UPI00325EFF3F